MPASDAFEPGELVRVFLGPRGSKWARVVRQLSPAMVYVEILKERTRARVQRSAIRRLDDLLAGSAPSTLPPDGVPWSSATNNAPPPNVAPTLSRKPWDDDHEQTNARRWSGAGRDGTGE